MLKGLKVPLFFVVLALACCCLRSPIQELLYNNSAMQTMSTLHVAASCQTLHYGVWSVKAVRNCMASKQTQAGCVLPGDSLCRSAKLSACCPARQFTQAKANDEIRWAVLNVISLLRRHHGIQDELAGAMASGQTVGACVTLIERGLRSADDI